MTLTALLPLLVLGLLVATGLGGVITARWLRLRESAARLGIARSGMWRWAGALQGRPLLIAAPPLGVVRLAMASPQPVALRRRDPVLDLADPSLPLGDAAFGAEVHVTGDLATALLWLGPTRRAQIRAVLAKADVACGPLGLMARCSAREVLPAVEALWELHEALDAEGLPPLRDRWQEEVVPRVRVRLLEAFLPDPEHRDWLLEAAADDPSPEVRDAVAHARGDQASLLQQVLTGLDHQAAERAFQRLRDDDPAALARHMLEHLIAAGPNARLVRQLGTLRSPLVVPWLNRKVPDLHREQLERLDSVIMGLALASPTTGTPMADLMVTTMSRCPSADVWKQGLELLRRHGEPEHVQRLPPPPQPRFEEDLARTLRTLQDAQLARHLMERHGLQREGDFLRGDVGGQITTVLLQPDGATLLIAGLPSELRLQRATDDANDFSARFTYTESMVWGPAERDAVIALDELGEISIGTPRAGALQAGCRRATESWVLQGIATASTLRSASRVEPLERVAVLLDVERDSLWLTRWLHQARRLGLPPRSHTPWQTHLDHSVRVAYACWHGDDRALIELLDLPDLSNEDRDHAITTLVQHSPAALTQALTLHPEATLWALLSHPGPERVAAVMAWWQAESPDGPNLRKLALELSLAAPHPSAEPLWCEAIRDAHPPKGLGEAMVHHGGRASWSALDLARRTASDPARAASLAKVASALRRRLGADGAVSIAHASGELSIAASSPSVGALSPSEPER